MKQYIKCPNCNNKNYQNEIIEPNLNKLPVILCANCNHNFEITDLFYEFIGDEERIINGKLLPPDITHHQVTIYKPFNFNKWV